jgi:DNA-directed RNA polymerase specialized sigma subunit
MEAAPHEPIEQSIEELLPLRHVLSEAFDRLDERDRWIVNAILVERQSIRNCAADLSLAKSHVDRLYKRALNSLRTMLEDEPLIVEYLTNDRT